jgi:hypothetical protein
MHASPHHAATETIDPPPLGTGGCGLEEKVAPEKAFTMRLIITLGLLCVAMGETNTVRLARARRSYTTYT